MGRSPLVLIKLCRAGKVGQHVALGGQAFSFLPATEIEMTRHRKPKESVSVGLDA